MLVEEPADLVGPHLELAPRDRSFGAVPVDHDQVGVVGAERGDLGQPRAVGDDLRWLTRPPPRPCRSRRGSVLAPLSHHGAPRRGPPRSLGIDACTPLSAADALVAYRLPAFAGRTIWGEAGPSGGGTLRGVTLRRVEGEGRRYGGQRAATAGHRFRRPRRRARHGLEGLRRARVPGPARPPGRRGPGAGHAAGVPDTPSSSDASRRRATRRGPTDVGGETWDDELGRKMGRPGGYDPHARLVDMDADGIDVAVLYPTSMLTWVEDADALRRRLPGLQQLAARLLLGGADPALRRRRSCRCRTSTPRSSRCAAASSNSASRR